MTKLAVVVATTLVVSGASAQDADNPQGWDGDRGLHLAADGRWHRSWRAAMSTDLRNCVGRGRNKTYCRN